MQDIAAARRGFRRAMQTPINSILAACLQDWGRVEGTGSRAQVRASFDWKRPVAVATHFRATGFAEFLKVFLRPPRPFALGHHSVVDLGER